MIDRRHVLAVLLLAVATRAPAQAPADPVALLERMSSALQALEYEGTLAYVHEGRIDTIRVTRSLGAEGPQDRLVTLSGDFREVVSDPARLQCLTPAGTIDAPLEVRGVMPVLRAGQSQRLAQHYRLAIAGVDRVAGFDATVLDAAPLDARRYAYRLWLERASGMLLASMLREPGGTLVEHLAFTELQLRQVDPVAARAADAAAPKPGVWSFPGLPEGFELVRGVQGDSPRQHLLFSDGLASVSVYIDPPGAGLSGAARRGAVNAFGIAAEGAHLVVVGDLPAATIEAVARSGVRRE
jgi:sigma-E factor negative regulatory protein RseB